jgi:hypothetical protein
MLEGKDGFRIIGFDEEQTPDDLAYAAPATVAVIDQQLYVEIGDWEPGDLVGWAHGTAVVTHHGRAVCHVTFVFEGEDTLVVHGVVPIDGSSIGNGHLAVTGGTGRYKGAVGTMSVETRNPKRWIFAP